MTRPARADEELDVVLDGHRHLFASELGPAVEAARMLGAELRAIQIAPEVAEQHIAMALARAREAAVRARWRTVRRTVVAMVAAATLVVGPAALAAGAALPGEPLYPLKRSIEAADLALALSPASEARAHTRIAEARLRELHALIRKGRTRQLPGAVLALREAMLDANAAVAKAMQADGSTSATNAAADQLDAVKAGTIGELKVLITQGPDLNVTPQLAAELLNALPPVSPSTTSGPVPTPTSPGAPATNATTGSTAPPPTAGGGATSTAPPATEPPTTQAPTTQAPTTQAPPPTTPDNQPTDPAPEDLPQ
jgi:Domain of unknown function (DUF5667)